MMKTKTIRTGIFAGIPQKAILLASKFVQTNNVKSVQVRYLHNGKTYTQSVVVEGGAR